MFQIRWERCGKIGAFFNVLGTIPQRLVLSPNPPTTFFCSSGGWWQPRFFVRIKLGTTRARINGARVRPTLSRDRERLFPSVVSVYNKLHLHNFTRHYLDTDNHTITILGWQDAENTSWDPQCPTRITPTQDVESRKYPSLVRNWNKTTRILPVTTSTLTVAPWRIWDGTMRETRPGIQNARPESLRPRMRKAQNNCG